MLRLATVFSAKLGCEPNQVIVLLVHNASGVGAAVRQCMGRPRVIDVSVIPGVQRDLSRWLEHLALAGPVYDCRATVEGIGVIVVDEHGDMAHCGIAVETTAAEPGAKNRALIPRG